MKTLKEQWKNWGPYKKAMSATFGLLMLMYVLFSFGLGIIRFAVVGDWACLLGEHLSFPNFVLCWIGLLIPWILYVLLPASIICLFITWIYVRRKKIK